MHTPTQAQDIARVADFAHRAIARRLERAGITWELTVQGDESRILAELRRGELVLPSEVRGLRWWEPVKRTRASAIAERLASLLVRLHRTYAEADVTGRLRLELWELVDGSLAWEEQPGARQVTAVLEPGCRASSESGGRNGLIARLGDPVALKLVYCS